MKERDSVGSERSRAKRNRPASVTSPVSVWKEKENVGGNIVDTGVVILRTSGCRHFSDGGCSMCGYNVESRDGISEADLAAQFKNASARLDDIEFLKVYTSGSFLDDRETPNGIRELILRWCADRGLRLLVESRAQFVTDDVMNALTGIHGDLEIAIGLESANDRVLKYAINKNMTVADYDRAATAVKKAGASLRSYVLLKPPFLTEAEAVEDALATAKHAALQSDTISVNPVNVQKGTLVELLWRNWAYRPPWLWSVMEVLNSCTALDRKIVCEPTGGGKERGAHNCGSCDAYLLDAIRERSISQNRKDIETLECECKGMWESVVELEGLVADGTVDLQRMFRSRTH
ncbi:MAG: archaeosine biosynthesis radical SAM protein RaSEA [Methanobacteriota archaeon]|nr:MAG: archaeosine biosynthesis radical SAM protein RaSEA [Euryarchaeota archaeon]